MGERPSRSLKALPQKHVKGDMAEAMVERSKEVLSRAKVDLSTVRADLVTARADLALEKQRREAKVIETKKELADVEKRAEEAIIKYKASKINFVTEMAWAVVDFCKSKEFFAIYQAFDQKAFKKGFDMGMSECGATIMDHHTGLDLTFLDEEGEFEGEPSTATAKAPLAEPVPGPKLVCANLVCYP